MVSLEELRTEGTVILMDKPYEWTSFDVVAKLRNLCKKRLNQKKYKVGHAGTLDPLATGLLIICTGKKTKTIQEYQDMPKEYTGSFTLGATRPSFDMETEIDQTYDVDHITPEAMAEAALKMTGEIEQNVPIYSAVKVDGQRMYTLARKGEDVKIKSRLVMIHNFDIDISRFPIVDFRIACSKGTYIRAMADDFGKLLGSGAYLSALRRTKIGNFDVQDAKTIDSIVEEFNQL